MLKSIERRLALAEKALLVAMILAMVALSFLQVVLRDFWSTGILWADTLLRHLVLWTGFLGACLAAASDKQFAMDASQRLFSGKTKHLVNSVLHLFTAAVCAALLLAAISFFREEYSHAETLFTAFGFDAPAWAFELILPGGFALLSLHYAIKCLEDMVAFYQGPCARCNSSRTVPTNYSSMGERT